MKCSFEKKIYLYHELSGPEKEKVDGHLRSCATCRELHQDLILELKTLQEVHSEIYLHSNPQRLTERIMDTISNTKSHTSILERIFSYIDTRPMRLALGMVSSLLFVFFIAENRRGNMTGYESKTQSAHIVRGIVELNSSMFHKELKRKKDERETVSLYSCLRSCYDGNAPHDCIECKIRFPKN